MKKLLILITLVCIVGRLSAQSEIPTDSIKLKTGNYTEFGDFLIDMDLLMNPQLPEITHEFVFGPALSKDYNTMFKLDPKWTVTQGSLPYRTFSVFHPLGFGSGNEQLQTSTFTYNNNTRLTLYGQYNADGYRVPSRSGFPWDKNKFVGGMEVKFNNGFGIRLDVRREWNPYFPY